MNPCFSRRNAGLSSSSGGWAALLATALLLQGCGTYRSFDALEPERIPDTGLVETVSGESEKLAKNYDRLREQLDRVSAAVRTVQPEAPAYDPLENRIVSINMYNADIGRLLWTLAEQLHMNLIVDPQVLRQDIRASLYLQDVTAREVYQHILQTFDLRGEVRNGALRINMYEERVFNAGFLNSNIAINLSSGGDVFGNNASSGGASSGGGGDMLRADFSISGNSSKQLDSYEELENAVKSILGLNEEPLARTTAQGAKNQSVRNAAGAVPPQAPGKTVSGASYSLNQVTGSLYVKARPSQMRAISRLIDMNKDILRRQVQVEAQLIDVQLNDGYQFGVDWTVLRRQIAGSYGVNPLELQQASSIFPEGTLGHRAITIPAQVIGPATGSGNALGLGYGDKDYSVTMKALSSFGVLRVLSNPSVRVRNGTPALLSVGSNIRYISKTNSTTNNPGGGASTVSVDVETAALFSGVMVGVLPYIHDNGRIELLIHPVQTEVTPESLALIDVGGGSVVTLPRINYKGLTTTLNIGDGDIVMIGGLIDQNKSNDKNGIPGISDIPTVGNLFGEQSSSHSSRELVVVIRVRLL
ncbi:MAG: pilus (MSHA type) biogenesis protein MshL [Candidatus Accumulibacter sp.]|jgi:general secretion pathway protein D|nr:pilus (MSHA type) biogenesis protein MshL [Accumulibacter sp.]